MYKPAAWATCLVCNYRQIGPPPVTEQLVTGNPTYLYWAVANLGTNPVTQLIKFRFFVDGTQIGGYLLNPATLDPPGLAGSQYVTLSYPISVAAPGEHTILVNVDPQEWIADDDRSNNVCTFTGTWTAGGPVPSPVPPTPTGGSS